MTKSFSWSTVDGKPAKKHMWQFLSEPIVSIEDCLPQYNVHDGAIWSLKNGVIGDPCDMNGSLECKSAGVWSENWLKEKLGVTGKVDERLRRYKIGGLLNLGATCYINAFIQLLYFNLEFRDFVAGLTSSSPKPLIALSRLFAELWGSRKAFSDPREFVDSCSLSHSTQEDAGEFSAMFMNWIEDNGAGGIIDELFAGQYLNCVTCKSCGGKNERVEKFLDVAVDFPFDLHAEPEEPLKLEKLLTNALTEEVISGYFCERCGTRGDAVRSVCISKLPPYLRVTVNRLRFFDESRSRIPYQVSFPLKQLSLSSDSTGVNVLASGPTRQLDCVCILEHHSSSATSGHYTAIAREHHRRVDLTDDWWSLDDKVVEKYKFSGSGNSLLKRRRRVSPVDSDDSTILPNPVRASSGTAYLVVYVTRDSVSDEKWPEPIFDSTLTAAIEADNFALESEIADLEQRRRDRDAQASLRMEQSKSLVASFKDLEPLEISNACSLHEYSFLPASALREWTKGGDLQRALLMEDEEVLKPVHCKHASNRIGPHQVCSGAVKLFPNSLIPEDLHAVARPLSTAICLDCCHHLQAVFDILFKMDKLTRELLTFKKSETGPNIWILRETPALPLEIKEKCPTEAVIRLNAWISAAETLGELGTQSDLDMAEGLQCVHGNRRILDPLGKAALVPLDIVNSICQASKELHAVIPGSTAITLSRVFVEDEVACEQCVECSRADEAARKRQASECFRLLLNDSSSSVAVDGVYYMLPFNWWKTWKLFISNPSKPAPPRLSSDTFRLLLCDHGRLLYGLGEMNSKKYVLATEDEMQCILKHWGGEDEVVIPRLLGSMCDPEVCLECGPLQRVKDVDEMLARKSINVKRADASQATSTRHRGTLITSINELKSTSTGAEVKTLLVAKLASSGQFIQQASDLKLFLPALPNSTMRQSPFPDDLSIKAVVEKSWPSVTWEEYAAVFESILVLNAPPLMPIPGFEMKIKPDEEVKKKDTSDHDAGMIGSIFRRTNPEEDFTA